MTEMTCQQMVSDEVSDYVCTLPHNHAGEHSYIDAMGMCDVNEHCRASKTIPNGFQHNHGMPIPR